MITIFTTAKPFIGEFRISQLNALRSWKSLGSDIEVIIFGDGEGYEETAEKLGLLHVPYVRTTEKGTPLVNSMFELAEGLGRHSLQAYINCDIIILEGFLEAAMKLNFDRFMLVGRRWDMDINEEIDFGDESWRVKLKNRIKPENLHPPTGSDYFLYRTGIWKDLPPMVVGRAGYDNWLISYCRLNKIPVIDGSDAVAIVHQNHSYSHLSQGVNEAWTGREAQANLSLLGEWGNIFTLKDADWRLTQEGISKIGFKGDWLLLIKFFILHKDSIWGKFGLRFFKIIKSVFQRIRR